MKNKLIKFLFFLVSTFLIILSNNNIVYSNDELIIKSDIINYENGNNIITASGSVKANYKDGFLELFSDNLKYIKEEEKIILKGNVKIIDYENDFIIYSNYIEYKKNTETIFSKNSTQIKISKNYNIQTSNLNYSILNNKIETNDKTYLSDDLSNSIEADGFSYNTVNKLFKSMKAKISDNNSNNYYTKKVIFNLTDKKIAAQNPEIYFSADNNISSNSRLKGRSMTSENGVTIVKKGIFTSCKPNEKCPPWSLQSDTIKHNKKKKIIYYDNAVLRLYDKPVFYFPKFFHPDPTVKRQSGFLLPSISSSSSYGDALNVPYFHVLSDSRDFTLSPKFYFNNDVLLQNEYRHVGKNFNHISDFSLKKLDKNSKSHFFSNSKIKLDSNSIDYSDIEVNIEKTSNDTYLKNDKLKNSIKNDFSLLNSFISYNSYTDDTSVSLEVAAYEDLTKDKKSDKFEFILPYFSISKLIPTEFDGELNFDTTGALQQKNTNVTEKYFINDLSYDSNNFISKLGTRSNINLTYKNVSKEGENSPTYRDKLKNDNFFITNFNTSLPFKKVGNTYNSYFTPKLLLKYSPFDSENLKDLDRSLNENNIFSNNRLGVQDSLEGGQSLTMGMDYKLNNKNDINIFSTSLGQVFRDTNDKNLPSKSMMQTKRSDVVGNLSFSPNKILNINYNFSADNDLKTFNYNLLETELNINNFVTSFNFLEENNEIGSKSYLESNVAYNFNSNNSLKYNTRRNRKTDMTEFYNLIYQYENDCLVAAVQYNKDYYNDRDLNPNEEIFFSITITPFTEINTPNLN